MRHVQLYLNLPDFSDDGILIDIISQSYVRINVSSPPTDRFEFDVMGDDDFNFVLGDWRKVSPVIMEYYE